MQRHSILEWQKLAFCSPWLPFSAPAAFASLSVSDTLISETTPTPISHPSSSERDKWLSPAGFRISFQPVNSKADWFQNTLFGMKSISWDIFKNVNSSLCPHLLLFSHHPPIARSIWFRPHGFLAPCTCLCRKQRLVRGTAAWQVADKCMQTIMASVIRMQYNVESICVVLKSNRRIKCELWGLSALWYDMITKQSMGDD